MIVGTFRLKFLRKLIPFWSSALPSLPVTAPPKKDADADDVQTRHHRPSRMDPRKILLVIAIMYFLMIFSFSIGSKISGLGNGSKFDWAETCRLVRPETHFRPKGCSFFFNKQMASNTITTVMLFHYTYFPE